MEMYERAPARKRGAKQKLSDEAIMSLYERYLAGERIETLARSSGIAPATVRAAFKRMRLVSLPRDKIPCAQTMERYHDMYICGSTLLDIAQTAGVSQRTISRWFSVSGYEVRPRGRRRRQGCAAAK